jgi:hypothetical protein
LKQLGGVEGELCARGTLQVLLQVTNGRRIGGRKREEESKSTRWGYALWTSKQRLLVRVIIVRDVRETTWRA